ncbi:tyrosine-type recombinase/integrase [Paenibacillus sp. DYY-L-2]|uniref:tyrosine-type recombinase/integrase n=1 Tax=Paenibacillus sp. DYY-L-2 TaxID=3447013 RepID=UPI003F4F7879
MIIHIGRVNDKELWVKLRHFQSEDLKRLRSALPGCRWDSESKSWRFSFSVDMIRRLYGCFPEGQFVPSEQLAVDSRFLEAIKEGEAKPGEPKKRNSLVAKVEEDTVLTLKAKGYSYKTIKAYRGHIRRYLEYIDVQRENILSPEERDDHSMPLFERTIVREYALKLLEQGHSHAYVNQAISALRFLVAKVLKRSAEEARYLRPKKEKKLPYVLSGQEVLRILEAPNNLKHRAMLFLTYSSGLRVSEVVRLKLTDFDWDRGTISIRQGKGKKDRHTLLSRTAWELVQQYVKLEKPSVWLFPGQYPGTHLHERSLQKVFSEALGRSDVRDGV